MVFGYLPNIDLRDENAMRLGLLRRVAIVVMDSDIPHTGFYWTLIENLLARIAHDCVAFETFETRDGPLTFHSLDGLREFVQSHAGQFGTPFFRATLFTQGRTTSLIQIEPYATCGGPDPYHDSWTFAVYQDREDAVGLRKACYRACTEHDVEVLEEMYGLTTPAKSVGERAMDSLRGYLKWIRGWCQ